MKYHHFIYLLQSDKDVLLYSSSFYCEPFHSHWELTPRILLNFINTLRISAKKYNLVVKFSNFSYLLLHLGEKWQGCTSLFFIFLLPHLDLIPRITLDFYKHPEIFRSAKNLFVVTKYSNLIYLFSIFRGKVTRMYFFISNLSSLYCWPFNGQSF